MNDLVLQVDGVTRSFGQWTLSFVDTFYPNIGQDCYRVPAQHFNKQKICRNVNTRELHLLPPEPSSAAGDLAHTLVLEKMEELSQELRTRDGQPLFIISSVEYTDYLAKLKHCLPARKLKKKDQPNAKSRKKRKLTQNDLCYWDSEDERKQTEEGSIESTQDDREGKQPVVLPPLPADKGKQRGEIDVCLLHERSGVVLIEVKSTGRADSSWCPSKEQFTCALQRTVLKAVEQLKGSRDILRHIMSDLTLPSITLVVALPYVTKQHLSEAVQTETFDADFRFLCKDDLLPSKPSDKEAVSRTDAVPECQAESTDRYGCGELSLLSWWDDRVCCARDEAALSLDSMRTIVGRICGLMSIVGVWTRSKPRVEVRTVGQAISETGARMSDIVLLPSQVAMLAHPPLRLWLTGPAGSGKTLMLQIKGRQWVQEGKRVVVINVRTTARGRPVGHILEEAIRRAAQNDDLACGTVDRHDVALQEFSIDTLDKELATLGSTSNACFVVDELLSDMSIIAQKLMVHYPQCPIWCVASYACPVPPSFQRYRLGPVLRNPPSVQLLLKELDLNPNHREIYTTRSAARGLPCDGPPVIFIEHSKHNTDVRHLDCLECANELADIFQYVLGLELRPPTSTHNTESSETIPRSFSREKQNSKYANTSPLSFCDVLILSGLPLSTYRHVRDYHWEPHIPQVLQYMIYMGTCRFLSGLKQRGVPFKVVVDNTMKTIVFPDKDEVIIADFMGAHSLERKVVVFLRGGPLLTPEEIHTNLTRYETVRQRTTYSHHPQAVTPNLDEARSAQPGTEESLSEELVLFASLMYEVRDGLYPELPSTFSPLDAKAIVHTLLGNMMVAGTEYFVQGKEQADGHTAKPNPFDTQIDPEKLRPGMEFRCHLPALGRNWEEDKVAEKGEPIEEVEEDVDESDEVSVLGADSVFLLPDMTEEVEMREKEVRRLQQAMESLSEHDKDWEFFAASCCLSQYI